MTLRSLRRAERCSHSLVLFHREVRREMTLILGHLRSYVEQSLQSSPSLKVIWERCSICSVRLLSRYYSTRFYRGSRRLTMRDFLRVSSSLRRSRDQGWMGYADRPAYRLSTNRKPMEASQRRRVRRPQLRVRVACKQLILGLDKASLLEPVKAM